MLGKGRQLEWTVNWPEEVKRQGCGAVGRTTRVSERYGCRNVLIVKLRQGGDDGIKALRLLYRWRYVLNMVNFAFQMMNLYFKMVILM